MLNTIKGAVFDLDGTLVDSLMLWDVLWDAFGKKYGVENFRPSEEADKAIRTMTLKDGMQMMHDLYKIGESGKDLLEEANRIIRKFYSEEVELKPGVREFLEQCKSLGIKMCIASATGPKLLQMAIDHCEIGHYFSDVLSCATIGKGKDQPDIYLAAMQRFGTSLDDTCVFEDSAVAIDTAHKIGMKTVAIYDKFNYGQEQMKATADVYIADGETLMKLAAKK